MQHVYFIASVLLLAGAVVEAGSMLFALFLASSVFLVACALVAGEKETRERT